MTETLAQVYGSDRLGRVFGYRDKVYAGGWHRGLDVRKQVPSGAYSISHDVLAIFSGRVVAVVRKTKIGLTIVIDTGRKVGRYESHSHLRNAQVSVGDYVSSGQRIAETDTNARTAGSSWAGPHDHIVFSNSSDAAWNTARAVFDPLPMIREVLATPAGGTSKPVPKPTPTPTEEEDTMFIANIKGGNFYLVLNGKAAALGAGSEARKSGIPILNFTDDWAVAQLRTIVSGIGNH